MKRGITCWIAVCLGLLALSAGPALAAKGGAGTETFTSHELEPFAFPGENPCTHEGGMLVASPKTSVFHITTQTDGETWVTGTSQGLVEFVPSGGGAVFTGHFTVWFGESLNQRNEVGHDTATFVLTGPEGSRAVVHMTGHASTNANGVVTVEFEKEHERATCA